MVRWRKIEDASAEVSRNSKLVLQHLPAPDLRSPLPILWPVVIGGPRIAGRCRRR